MMSDSICENAGEYETTQFVPRYKPVNEIEPENYSDDEDEFMSWKDNLNFYNVNVFMADSSSDSEYDDYDDYDDADSNSIIVVEVCPVYNRFY